MWSVTGPSEGTLPLTPPLPSVVELLAHLGPVEESVANLTAHLVTQTTTVSLENISSGNKQMAYLCHELAALALRVVSGSPCSSAQGYVVEVQQLSQGIARACQTVNHIVKKGLDGDSTTRRKETKSQTSKRLKKTETVLPKSPAVEGGKESRTSMETGQQLTRSPEHRVNGRPVKQDMYTSIVDDDDSTLI